MLLGNQRPNRKQEAPGERGLNISASFPELKAACQGLRAFLVLISPQPQIVRTPRTSWTLIPISFAPLRGGGWILKGPMLESMYVHTHTHTHTRLQSHFLALASDEAGSLTEMSAHTSRLPAAAVAACAGL